MRVTSVEFEQTFNTGNFTNHKVRMSAELDVGDDPAQGAAWLRTLVQDQDPVRVQARAVLADPAHHGDWEVRQAYQTLGQPVPAALAAAEQPARQRAVAGGPDGRRYAAADDENPF